jgi:hypothetical protein
VVSAGKTTSSRAHPAFVRAVREAQAAHLSGLILTASLAGQVIGIAAFVGVYLSAAARSSAHGLVVTTWALSAVLALTAACASRASAAQ